MLQCAHCGKLLPNAVRKLQTSKMVNNAACSPLCKIRGQLVTLSPAGCWIFGRPCFTWNQRSYSIRGFLYSYYFDTPSLPETIVMKCGNAMCANPEHMLSHRKMIIIVRRDT